MLALSLLNHPIIPATSFVVREFVIVASCSYAMVSIVIWALFESPMEVMSPFRLLQVVLAVTGCVFLTLGVVEWVYRQMFPVERGRDVEKVQGEGDVGRDMEKGAVLA
ncbi:uncharacterized protein LACBIDRAFT_304765 [Laccaria bicolor S238N-H82]|uniref:Predicted protein n=1 Tax=Laccaria bicolor (strain S238N-H82 / ATCC MYA-4686) TaxID=486041 RepID=B0DMA3_LACBS|nr:uncharacterized protein LACBIDRAFT_304765 [Laccaria bicolor S238N-H82]EDR04245.1 predicted protein [Laccaria bicolor S238N-H82]|eukprot:XP_001885136.1 predicted protein [Laccaria bicolor S238N-H82]